MAKDKKIKDAESPKSEILAVYFKSLTLENVKCFKDKNTIDLSDGADKPAMWTVILGNNNTGKTTILKCLAGLEGDRDIRMIDNLENELNPNGLLNKNNTDKLKDNFTYPIAFRSLKNEFNWFLGSSNIDREISCILCLTEKKSLKDWGIWLKKLDSKEASVIDNNKLDDFKIYPYSTTRKISDNGVGKNENNLDVQLRFFKGTDLPNIEEWLLQLFLSEKLGQTKATNIIAQVKNVLTSGLLPDVNGLDIKSIESGNSFENFIEFTTDYGKVRLKDLGYGYQSMMGWVLDLVRRMVERYPSVEKPLEQPAIVLVDEIDLHLHPEWQRKIIAHLTKYFPKTQFIVTAHSPLIVQSAERVNVVLLKKEGDHVTIEQPTIKNFRGWTVDEILEDLMQLGDHVMSDTYLTLVHDFDAALDNDDFENAEKAYNSLSKILHPQSNRRKLMEIQMTSLSPA
jgi:predicted ATP-binding protein involved in virulence